MSKPSYPLQQAILEQIRAIQDVKELKLVEKTLIIDGLPSIKEETDYRSVFILGVENLGALLYGYLDEIAQAYYSKHIIFLEGWWNSEAMPLIKDESFLDAYKLAPTSSEDKSIQTKSDFMLAFQCREAKKMFLQLNLFIQRTDLLSDTLERVEVKKHE